MHVHILVWLLHNKSNHELHSATNKDQKLHFKLLQLKKHSLRPCGNMSIQATKQSKALVSFPQLVNKINGSLHDSLLWPSNMQREHEVGQVNCDPTLISYLSLPFPEDLIEAGKLHTKFIQQSSRILWMATDDRHHWTLHHLESSLQFLAYLEHVAMMQENRESPKLQLSS